MKKNGTNLTGKQLYDIVIGGAGRKRVEYDAKDFKAQKFPESTINTYKKWFQNNPDAIPVWLDRTGGIVAADGWINMNLNGSPSSVNVLKSTYSEDEEDGLHPNNLGYANGAYRYILNGKPNFETNGILHLRTSEGKDSSMFSGPHEISHTTTSEGLKSRNLLKNKSYMDLMNSSNEMFYKNKIDEAYGSVNSAEKGRMLNELKLKLLMNGDVKPENIHDFKTVAPVLLRYFDELDKRPESFESLFYEKPEFRPLLESYYQFKNLYKGDRNAWYNGEFKNYETAQNTNRYQQNGYKGNKIPKTTPLQRLSGNSRDFVA